MNSGIDRCLCVIVMLVNDGVVLFLVRLLNSLMWLVLLVCVVSVEVSELLVIFRVSCVFMFGCLCRLMVSYVGYFGVVYCILYRWSCDVMCRCLFCFVCLLLGSIFVMFCLFLVVCVLYGWLFCGRFVLVSVFGVLVWLLGMRWCCGLFFYLCLRWWLYLFCCWCIGWYWWLGCCWFGCVVFRLCCWWCRCWLGYRGYLVLVCWWCCGCCCC